MSAESFAVITRRICADSPPGYLFVAALCLALISIGAGGFWISNSRRRCWRARHCSRPRPMRRRCSRIARI